jgi:hypothetical protein
MKKEYKALIRYEHKDTKFECYYPIFASSLIGAKRIVTKKYLNQFRKLILLELA